MLRSTKQGESVSLIVARQEEMFLPRELTLQPPPDPWWLPALWAGAERDTLASPRRFQAERGRGRVPPGQSRPGPPEIARYGGTVAFHRRAEPARADAAEALPGRAGVSGNSERRCRGLEQVPLGGLGY
ncbi:hypothetical protein COCON_G00054830 [Conger conger]|uniref:Uncharacterized protein n=1 Tax=Conger conger TaxID=82655 RepID=A0A9Q1DWD6_CONCO|nr:hypothetical protein COCON_G00054830 [Conger conger]